MVALVVGMLAAMMVVTSDAGATVTLTASQPDTLYTTDTEFDCGELAGRADADLPWNVVRIRADDDTGQATAFQWKFPKPDRGFLMPDDPEIDSSAGGAFAVQGFCAQIGSGCVFTKDTLKSYQRPTILWAAPTCEEPPNNTRSPFDGDTVRIRVKAKAGKRKVGKASLDIGYGRLGAPVLWVSNLDRLPDDGIGKKQIVTGLLPTFSVTLDPTIDPPSPIEDYFFDNGEGASTSADSCSFGGAAADALACTALEYSGLGPFTPHVEVRLEDGSAYCDHATTRVATCQAKAQVVVERSPRSQTYTSPTTAEVTVRLRNQAPRSNGCTFIFDQLKCDTSVKRGKFEETESVTFEPSRCDDDRSRFCMIDADCDTEGPCLSASHCSITTEQPCTRDSECSTRECDACEPNETCIRVVQVPLPPVIFPGEEVELLRESVELRSVLKGKAKMTETWSAKELFNRGNDETSVRYKIRGTPVQ